MNPGAHHIALFLVGIGIVAFLAFLVLVGGCGAPPMPPEPPFTETVAASSRDR